MPSVISFAIIKLSHRIRNILRKIVNGVVQRIEKKNIYLDIGKTEAYLAPGEQVSTESYNFHQRLKVYVTEVRKTTKGPVVNVSRSVLRFPVILIYSSFLELSTGYATF